MKRISKTEIKEMRSQSKKNSIMFAFTLPTVILYTIFFLVTSENIISFLEAHQYACEGLLPLDGDVIIFVGIMDSDFRTESIEAFYVPKGTFVKLNPLIVHGTQYPVDKEDVHIVCMLPGRTFKNDMLSRRLETGEQIRITRGYKK